MRAYRSPRRSLPDFAVDMANRNLRSDVRRAEVSDKMLRALKVVAGCDLHPDILAVVDAAIRKAEGKSNG